MAELIDHKLIELPTLYAVGVQLDVPNTGNNPIPAQWQAQFQAGLFGRLEQLPGAYTPDYMGIIHSWPGDMSRFYYIIGMLFEAPPADVPEGCGVHELAGGPTICGYVRGRDESYVIAQAHDLTMARVEKLGYSFDLERLWLLEGYNCPRYTTPDSQGRIIFDYYVPVKRR